MARNNLLTQVTEKTRKRRSNTGSDSLRKRARKVVAGSRTREFRAEPPVMVRGGMTNMPFAVRKATQTRSRRRVDVSLNIPGAEMRLPSLPRIALDFRMVSGILVAALLALLYQFWNSPSYRVETTQVIGLQRLTTREVNAVLEVTDEPIFALDPHTLEESLLQAFPEFMSASIKVGLPNKVSVEVVERQPILTWKQDGRTILVDANGVSFPLRDSALTTTPVVVEATGSPAIVQPEGAETGRSQFMPVEMVTGILSMSAQAPKDVPLVYDRSHGLGWVDAGGWQVYFGDVRDIDTKLRIYNAIIEQLRVEGITPELVSVEHIHTPYYRASQ